MRRVKLTEVLEAFVDELRTTGVQLLDIHSVCVPPGERNDTVRGQLYPALLTLQGTERGGKGVIS